MADASTPTAPATPVTPTPAPPEGTPAVVPKDARGQHFATADDASIWEQMFGEGGKYDTVAPKAKAKRAPQPEAKPEPENDNAEPETEDAAEAEPQRRERLPDNLDVNKDEELEAGEVSSKTLVEARKAFQRGDIREAFKLAFGRHPEYFDVNPAKVRKWRARVDRDNAAIDTRRNEVQAKISEFNQHIERFNQQASFPIAIQNIAKAYRETGDTQHFVKLVETLTGETIDVAMKRVLKNERSTPMEQRLARQVQELQSKLEQAITPKPKSPEDVAKEQEATRQAAVSQYLEGLQSELAGHKVLKVPGGVKKVYEVLRKSWDPVLKSPSKSPEDAADEVMALERTRLQKLKGALEDEPTQPATPAAKRGARTLSRQQSTTSKPKGEETLDDIFERSWRQVEQRKVGKR